MELQFEWDSGKAEGNLRKHGITFAEASTVLGDRFSLTIHDPDHSSLREERFVTLGLSARQRLLVVVHCDRGERIRIIGARKATGSERSQYEKRREEAIGGEKAV